MAMANISFQHRSMSSIAFICVILFVFNFFLTSSASGDDSLSAYQVLQQYNFPIGILPEGVTAYELNRETGEFKAYLNETCSFPIESYQLKYKSTISGTISQNRITNLKGVSVKVLILWLNISEVIRDGDDLEFSVGIASADFPVDNFYECPKCGCGLDCATGQGLKVKFNRFVSSN